MKNGSPPPRIGRIEPDPGQMSLLVKLSRQISSRTDVDVVLRQVVEYSLKLTGAERGFLFLSDGTDHLKVRVALDRDGQELLHEPIRVSSGVISAMLAHGIPIFLEDVKLNDMFARRRSITESGVQFIMGIPLKAKGRILGFVYVDNTESARKFTASDRQVLTSFADQAALALENARLSHENRRVEQDAALGRMSEQMLETVTECASRMSACQEILERIEDREVRQELESSLARIRCELESRARDFRHYRELVNDEIQVRIESANMDELVGEVLDDLSPVLAEAGAAMHVSLNLGRMSLFDPRGLRRAVEAVLLNAADAVRGCPDPEIAVTTAPVPEGLLVEVRDNGVGMSREVVEKAFEPFFSLGKETGAGLGLALARRIVERHRGHIEIKSDEGQGTAVWIVIPSDLRQSLIPRRRSTNPPPPGRF
jgi:signal transduction histidine kinase